MAANTLKKSHTVITPSEAGTSPFSVTKVSLMNKDSLRGIATVKVMELVYLTGLRIVEGKNGLFVTMPARKTAVGEYQDIFFAACREQRDSLSAAVLEAYGKEVMTHHALNH